MLRSILKNKLRKVSAILVSLGQLLWPGAVSATDFAWNSSDAAEFRSYCVDYYSPTQCDDALRFILKTYGLRYIAALHMNEDPRGYLDSLRTVIEAGKRASPALATSVQAQIASYSSSSKAVVVVSSTLSSMDAGPLYMRVVRGRIKEKLVGVAMVSGIYYQVSGAVSLTVDGNEQKIHKSEGIYIPAGSSFLAKPVDDEPAIYLQFLLSPLADMSADGHELYRSTSPIPGVMDGSYALDLKRVTLPFQAPPDPPHRRSGAALHLVLSGSGAETANGRTVGKGPGSFSYEPAPTVYQWSNPGNFPLTYLVFNLNPVSKNAVLADGSGDNIQ
jgi:mannose-6-phosphate isomerase-like protein (cupin superfamily)